MLPRLEAKPGDLFVGYFLTRRKNKLSPAEKMNVQVKNRLPAVSIGIDDSAIAILGKAFISRNLCRC